VNRSIHSKTGFRGIWLALLLAIGFRALVPSGFMPMVDAGGLTMVLCAGDGPMLPAAGPQPGHGDMPGMDMSAMDMASMHHGGAGGDHGPMGHGPAGDAAHRHAPCLFAASALPSPTQGVALALPAFVPAGLAPAEGLVAAPIGRLLRAQSPRAPPALA
jgi:hypothetical protein